MLIILSSYTFYFSIFYHHFRSNINFLNKYTLLIEISHVLYHKDNLNFLKDSSFFYAKNIKIHYLIYTLEIYRNAMQFPCE